MENRRKILYLSMNNGTDARISKEVETLSDYFDIDFLGIGTENNENVIARYLSSYALVIGTHRNLFKLLRFLYLIIIRKKKEYQYIYVVDEQLLILILPFIIRKRIVLDVFDSIFLKWNLEGNKMYYFKFLLYFNVETIIVTDEYRFDLLPVFAKTKAFILPNYPVYLSFDHVKVLSSDEKVVLGIFGTLVKDRGLDVVNDLLNKYPLLEVHCGGWLGDDFAKEFVARPKVKYLGICSRDKINNHVFHEIDYIVAIYPENNLNNYNASPTKLFDAIMCRTPVIMNRWVRISSFVENNNLGLVVDLDAVGLSHINYQDLLDFKSNYDYHIYDSLVKKYSWNNFVKPYKNIFSE